MATTQTPPTADSPHPTPPRPREHRTAPVEIILERARRSYAAGALLDPEGAAALLGVTRRTLEAWRIRGGGPVYIRLSRGNIRYRPADLAAWIDARRVASTSDRGAA
jgi:hypothetical protein